MFYKQKKQQFERVIGLLFFVWVKQFRPKYKQFIRLKSLIFA